MQDNWVKDVWKEACYRTGGHLTHDDLSPILLQHEEACLVVFVTSGTASLGFQKFRCSSMKLLNDMKTKARSAVESSYEFETSQALRSISRNASRAQALLAETTFIYRVYLIILHL